MKDCNGCGKCCIKYGDDLATTPEEIHQWELFRPDIFRYAHEGRIWVDPDSKAPLAQCPFLEMQAGTNGPLYLCSIYADRPEDCRVYPASVTEMVQDGCEMIEVTDLANPRRAEAALRSRRE